MRCVGDSWGSIGLMLLEMMGEKGTGKGRKEGKEEVTDRLTVAPLSAKTNGHTSRGHRLEYFPLQ